MRSLPLTLTLSPRAWRGDAPHANDAANGSGAAWTLLPAGGEQVPAGG